MNYFTNLKNEANLQLSKTMADYKSQVEESETLRISRLLNPDNAKLKKIFKKHKLPKFEATSSYLRDALTKAQQTIDREEEYNN